MRTSATALGAALLALLCPGSAAVAFLVLFQIRAAPLPFLRSYLLQRSARSHACQPPAQLVPGCYQLLMMDAHLLSLVTKAALVDPHCLVM